MHFSRQVFAACSILGRSAGRSLQADGPKEVLLPRVGLAVPVTAALDFTPSAPAAGRVRDATLGL